MNRSLEDHFGDMSSAPVTDPTPTHAELPPEERVGVLNSIYQRIVAKERATGSGSYAFRSPMTRGRLRRESKRKIENRTPFAKDRDRIIYSSAFFKLSEKTQVFLSPRNPLIADRLTHTLQVAQIGRTIGRAINANEDLIEAIALGHDLGHTPFGHTGEKVLDKKCKEYDIGEFRHNVHSVRVVDGVEKGGRGLNLCWEVREGIICHNGEVAEIEIYPTAERATEDIWSWSIDEINAPASTIEGCIVRLSDKIAYAGKDIEDGIAAGIVTRSDIPSEYTTVLGESNSQIIDTLVKDVIVNFEVDLESFKREKHRDPKPHEISIRLSPSIGTAMNDMIFHFNYKRIYLSGANTKYANQTETIISGLFDAFIAELHALCSKPFSKLSDFHFEPSDGAVVFNNDLRKRCFQHLLGMSLQELEAYKRDLDRDFSVGLLTEVFTREEDQEGLRRAVNESKLNEFTEWYFTIIDDVRLRILKDNFADPRAGSKTSVLNFLRSMNDEYLLGHYSAEFVRDYVASLTDELAIRIFKMLTIPEAIV